LAGSEREIKTKKLIITLVLVFSIVAQGSYNSTPVEVMSGGYGGRGGADPTGPTGTVFDAAYPCTVAGMIKTVRLSMWSNTGSTPASSVKFKVMRGSSSPYTVVSDANITQQVNAIKQAGYFTVTIDMTSYNLSIAVGDYVGMYLPDGLYLASKTGTTDGKYGRNGGHLGNIDEMPPSTTGTFDIYTTTYLMIDYTVVPINANQYTITNTNRGNGFTAHGTIISLPYFADQNQYIVLKNVHGIGANENLSINLYYSDASAQNVNVDSIVLNLSTNTISDTANGNSAALGSANGHNWDVFIWTSQAPKKIHVVFCDIYDAAYSYNKSISAGVPASIADCNIRRLTLTQTAGTTAHVDSVSVCRKPIVVVSDSFGASGSGSVYELIYVGPYLGTAFTQPRYVIPCGISGGGLLWSSIPNRWNGTGQGCTFRDAVIVFLNGPGLNDFASVTMSGSDFVSYRTMMFSVLTKMVGEAIDRRDIYGGTNDVIMSEMINYYDNGTYSTPAKTEMIKKYNEMISFLAYSNNIPLARTFYGFDPNTMLQGSGPHPNEVGSPWIASEIAMAYEHNTVPGTSPCQYSLAGDLNGDCKVDLYDFAQMASNWLINCDTDPNNPECYAK
jgi:hypothetical protein